MPTKQFARVEREQVMLAAALDSEATSSSFDLTGVSQLTVLCNYTFSTASEVLVSLDVSDDAGTTWYVAQTASVSGGTVSLNDISYKKAVSSSKLWAFNLSANYPFCRLRASSTGGAAADTLTIDLLRGTQ